MSTPIRPIFSTLRFFALVSLFLIAIEFAVRLSTANLHPFWHEVDSTSTHIDLLFVGSSRVAAAIDLDTAGTFFPNRTSIRIVNAGTGYATSAEYFLALRNTLVAHPNQLDNATLFLEAPGEMPDLQSWSVPWPHSARPDILPPLLTSPDLSRYWSGPHNFEDKLKLSADFLLQPWATYSRSRIVGHQLTSLPHDFLQRPFEKALLKPSPKMLGFSNLTTAGGIRTDDEGIALARTVAHEYVRDLLQNQKSIDWSSTIPADIATLAQTHNIHLIFFAPPLHSLFQSAYQTPTRLADRAAFQKIAAQWHTPLLIANFPTTDESFPDLWHLQMSDAPAYTTALLQAWQKEITQPK